MTKLPPPPPMTSDEIVEHLREGWLENVGVGEYEATLRAEQGFRGLLRRGAIREWGFSPGGETLYETHIPAPSEIIWFVLMDKKEE